MYDMTLVHDHENDIGAQISYSCFVHRGHVQIAFLADASAKALTPRAVSGHSDFMHVFFTYINIYVFETRKA